MMANSAFYVAKLSFGGFGIVVTHESPTKAGTLLIKTIPSDNPQEDYRLKSSYDWSPEGQDMYVDISTIYVVAIEDLGGQPIGKLTPEDYVGLYNAIMERKASLS